MKKFILTLSLILLLTGCSINLPFSGTVVNEEDAVAKIIYDGETTYYDNFNDAWTFINKNVDKDVELVLLTDWIAEDGVFGEGLGYGETGNLTPVDRKNKNITVTINLNNYTLNRNLTNAVKSGNVISIKKDGIYHIKDGTITGGNTSDRGGALWLDNDETTVKLENITITNNHADGNGGGIFTKSSDLKLDLINVTIINNNSNNYGGAMYVQEGDEKINLSGVVVIKNNQGKDNRNNITLQSTFNAIADIDGELNDILGLKEGSEIYIATSNFKENKDIANTGTEISTRYFKCDNTNLKIKFINDNGHQRLITSK